MNIPDVVFSAGGKYRYWLSRAWSRGSGWLIFVMLNPSIADAIRNDATITRCIGFGKDTGHRGIVVVNLYGGVATDPVDLFKMKDPVGPRNDHYITKACELASRDGTLLLAYGGTAAAQTGLQREFVRWQAERFELPVYCLGVTDAGLPRHPLYLAKTTKLQNFTWNEAI